MHRIWLIAGAASAFIALAIAAAVGHGLKGEFAPVARVILDTAREIHFVHALAMIAVGILVMQPGRHLFLHLAGIAFVIGTLLFCGGLYGSVRLGAGGAQPLIPVGGVSLFIGWILFALGCWFVRKQNA